ncbi:MAG: ferrochelatase [Anaerolineae bacterium]|nr:ferrochelatase [Anaerolineae bacterium]
MVHGETGVLLMAHGSPGRLDDLEAYYTHIRGGRRPSPEEVARLKERYRRIGGRSPLSQITHAQAQALEKNLNRGGRRFRAYVGMRHWRPFIHEAVGQMVIDGIQEAVGLALTPHYSRLGVGAYIEAAQQALDLKVRFVESWHDHPLFLGALAERVRQGLARFPQEERGTVIFTAHSLPERILEWDDPYPRQLQETCATVAQRLGLAHWRLAYQGARRADEPWLGPDVLEVLDRLAQQDRPAALICPVGFVADHLEVLYDIDVECRERAAQLGLHLERTISFNDDPRFIRALAAIVEENLP